jgi:hypothetical protein
MKMVGLFKRVATVMAASMVAFSVKVSADTAGQLAICKSELKTIYGEGTRVSMYGTKSYRGVKTLKLKVTPEGDSSVMLQCLSDTESDERVVLKDKNGDTLVS